MKTKYGKWRVLSCESNYCLCECACGVRKNIYKYNLISGRSSRCKSCATRERNIAKPRKPRDVKFGDAILPINEWAEKLGYSSGRLNSRLKQFSLKKALSPRRIVMKITYADITLSVEQWALLLKVCRVGLYKRLDRMPHNEVLSTMFLGNRKKRQVYVLRLQKTITAIKSAVRIAA